MRFAQYRHQPRLLGLQRSLLSCSICYVDQLTRDQAERELVAWATANACRDEVIRAAYRAGVAKNRIHTITGIARTTIDRILEEHTVRRGFMQMATREEVAQFLQEFTRDWPRDPTWQGGPFPFRPRPAMAYQISAEDLAGQMFEAVGFRALRLGSWLNTPDGELMAAAVELLTPPPYEVDAKLLVDALKIAATRQRSAELEKAVGIGVVATIGAVLLSGSRS